MPRAERAGHPILIASAADELPTALPRPAPLSHHGMPWTVQPAESEVGTGDPQLGCSLVFLPITPSAPSLCWLWRRSHMQRRRTETSLDGG